MPNPSDRGIMPTTREDMAQKILRCMEEVESPIGRARWIADHILKWMQSLPSPTDAAVTEARDQIVEAARKWRKENPIALEHLLTPARNLASATDALLALTAPPKPPLEVALEALQNAVSLWGFASTDAPQRAWYEQARAAIRDIEAAIKGDGL